MRYQISFHRALKSVRAAKKILLFRNRRQKHYEPELEPSEGQLEVSRFFEEIFSFMLLYFVQTAEQPSPRPTSDHDIEPACNR